MDVKFRPSISLKVIVKYALEYEKIVSVFEKILECEYKKNESVTIIEVVEQKVEVKSKGDEYQVETSPPKTIFKMCKICNLTQFHKSVLNFETLFRPVGI